MTDPLLHGAIRDACNSDASHTTVCGFPYCECQLSARLGVLSTLIAQARAEGAAERAAELAALKAENTSLRAERDAAVSEGAVIGRMNAMKDAEAEIGRLRETLAELVRSVDDLINDSHGVAGLHLNGDIAPWGELTTGGRFEEWLLALETARAALEPKP